MKQDILINGVSVAELKRQKEAIQKDASRIVYNEMEKATKILNKLLQKSEDGWGYELTVSQEEADSLATEALEHLETAAIVARVANTTFYLPWDSEYDGDTPWSCKLDDSDANSKIFSKLYDVLSDMEGNSRSWNESRC